MRNAPSRGPRLSSPREVGPGRRRAEVAALPFRRARRAGAFGALLAAAVAVACAAGPTPAGGPGLPSTPEDTTPASRVDSARVPPDSAPAPGAAEDGLLQTLRDSARSLQQRRAHGQRREPAADSLARPPRSPAEADGAGGYPHGPVTTTDLERLRELGPVYTPYDRGPVLETGDRLDGMLEAALVPTIRKYELPPDTWARYWVLVDAEGQVQAAELQLSSGHGAFDRGAVAVAEHLRYTPATRDGEPVPVWVLARISLLMG